MFTLISGILSAILLRVPVCYIFGVALDWKLFGVGMGAPVASAGVLLITIVYLLTGAWKHNAVMGGAQSEA